jgi:flagellar biosynthesis protein FlhG
MHNRLEKILADSSATTKPRLYAFASGKGGVGKSVITFNLAWMLSKQSRVLLIDGDFQMGNLHILANSGATRGWQAPLAGHIPFSEAIVPIRDGLDLLPSIAEVSQEHFPNLKSLATSLADLRDSASGYDLILFDTASGILPHTNLILNTVDEIVLITTPELTSISDCYALYKILITNNKSLSVSLLINREDRREEVEYLYEKFTAMTGQFLGRTPAFGGSLGNDPALVESVAGQSAVAKYAPESRIAAQLALLAETFFNPAHPVGNYQQTINFTPVGADIKE